MCLSHLRWGFVFQRPQHLLSRAARDRRVFFIEEPVWDGGDDRLDVSVSHEGVHVVTPHLGDRRSAGRVEARQRELIDDLFAAHQIDDFVLWYYTPMALDFTRHLRPRATIYDVMDELSLFRFAPPALLEREEELYQRADIVFTGGQSLYEAKRHRHPNVHLFPSSVDTAHFGAARNGRDDPADQSTLPRPRLGFWGVIDERMDLALLAGLADARSDWHLVLIGPVVKIDTAELPRRPNIHYLGARGYADLPRYASGWDVALMLWARNDATRFISPTKTPEYLAAGLPVISTPIADIVAPYGELELVRLAETAADFEREIARALSESPAVRAEWLRRVDAFLKGGSWTGTWSSMQREITSVLAKGWTDGTATASRRRAWYPRFEGSPNV